MAAVLVKEKNEMWKEVSDKKVKEIVMVDGDFRIQANINPISQMRCVTVHVQLQVGYQAK